MGYGLGYHMLLELQYLTVHRKWQHFSTNLIMELITCGSSERLLPVTRWRQGPLRQPVGENVLSPQESPRKFVTQINRVAMHLFMGA